MKVISVKDHPKKKEWSYVTLLEDSGKEVEAFSLAAEAKNLQPGPLPAGWEIEPGGEWPDGNTKPPNLKAPRRNGGRGGYGGGAAAFRNSKEGQLYEQERMDRRTAIMQAVQMGGITGALVATVHGGVHSDARMDQILADAEKIYAFLRKGA